MRATVISSSLEVTLGWPDATIAALVDEALSRGAGQVYAALANPIPSVDQRVTPLRLDVTDQSDIAAAAQRIGDLDVLINNAGVLGLDDLTDRSSLTEHPRSTSSALTP
ncbi:MAG TPA: SDR family NAD(P)-dependent oxidoreductase [Microlunatus sp.]|nr:SDR family NAD(P)-dependent oxidoreductase [Microlunatus sp.]